MLLMTDGLPSEIWTQYTRIPLRNVEERVAWWILRVLTQWNVTNEILAVSWLRQTKSRL
jgi:hypothetical protein